MSQYAKLHISASVLLLILLISVKAQADTIYLKNGRTMEGIIKAQGQDTVDLEVFGGVVRFRKSEITRIEKATPEGEDTIRLKWEKKRMDTEKKAQEEKIRKELEPKQVEIIQKSDHMLVDVVLNKKVNVTLVLDTGASCLLLTNSVAKKLGVDINDKKLQTVELIMADGRKVNGKLVMLESVAAQGVEAQQVAAAVLPEDAGMGMESFNDGLLGMSFLKNFNFKIDHKNNKLILEKI